LLVAENGKEEETVIRLSRVGFDNILGHLNGGFEAWKTANKEIDTVNRIPATQLEQAINQGEVTVIDVRKESEYRAEHVADAYNKPLDFINEWFMTTDKSKPFYIHCAGGYRSMIFTSILRARGYENLIDIQGGFKAIKESGLFPTTDYVCPTTML
jgi:rhodanese-related sulfurtransferase